MDIVDPRIEEYVERLTSPHDPLLAELSAETAEELGSTSMLTGPVAGRLLELLVWVAQPTRVLEIGTFSGHSALAMAAALPRGGRIDACERDPARAAFAQRYFDHSPHGSKITLHVGPARETIERLEGDFDFVFIDADKQNIPDYFTWSLKLARPGSLIIVDNVVREGAVTNAKSRNPNVRGVRRFNDLLTEERSVSATTIQTVGVKGYDGFTLALVTG